MKKILSVIAAGVLLLLLLGYIFYVRPNYYLFNGGKVEFASEVRKELHRNQYLEMIAHEDSMYFCSREGLEKKSLDGHSEWTKPFQMLSPALKRAGDYFVVADILGHDAYLFHKSGFLANVRENLPIISAWVNSEGFLVLILESDLENRIKLYTKDGVPLIERGSVLAQDGYPIAADLSEDGIYLTTSHADALNGSLESKVTMFGFADYHENLDEFIVRADKYEAELIPEIHYFGKKFLWLIGTKAAHIYPMSNSKEIYEQPVNLEIKGDLLQTIFMEDGLLLYIDTKERNENRYLLQRYRQNGEKESELSFAEPPVLISAGKKHYYVINQEFVTKYKGDKKIWEYPFHEAVEQFHEIDDENYLVIQPMSYMVWKMKQIY